MKSNKSVIYSTACHIIQQAEQVDSVGMAGGHITTMYFKFYHQYASPAELGRFSIGILRRRMFMIEAASRAPSNNFFTKRSMVIQTEDLTLENWHYSSYDSSHTLQ